MRSKPAFLVTVWKFIVAAVYGPDMVSALLVLLKYGGLHGLPHFVVIALTSYASLAFWTLFFPLGGFIAVTMPFQQGRRKQSGDGQAQLDAGSEAGDNSHAKHAAKFWTYMTCSC